jgi:hypothetical protein
VQSADYQVNGSVCVVPPAVMLKPGLPLDPIVV